jgi:hypothetical protein
VADFWEGEGGKSGGTAVELLGSVPLFRLERVAVDEFGAGGFGKTNRHTTGDRWRSRLLHRLLTQIERILEINSRIVLTKEVVEAARETLVIGQV